MKPVKRIALLFVVVFSIVSFWLYPGINTAGDVQYVRRYENTDKNTYPAVAADTTNRKRSVSEKIAGAQTKKYKKETLKPEMELSKVKPEHFSRAIHFEEVMLDSVKVLEVGVVSDSTGIIQ